MTFLCSLSSPLSAAVLSDQPPNSLVNNFFQSLTVKPIRPKENPVPQHEPQAIFILLLLFNSSAHSSKTQPAEPQSIPPSPRPQPSNSTALIAPAQDLQASLSRPNRFQSNQYVSKQKRKETHSCRRKAVRRPILNSYLHYKLTNAFSSGEIVFWGSRRQQYTIQNTTFLSKILVVPLTAIEVQPVEWH